MPCCSLKGTLFLQTSAALHLSPLSKKISRHIFLKNAFLLVCKTPFLHSLTIEWMCGCRAGSVNMITDVLYSVNMYILFFVCKALWAKSWCGHCAIEVIWSSSSSSSSSSSEWCVWLLMSSYWWVNLRIAALATIECYWKCEGWPHLADTIVHL